MNEDLRKWFKEKWVDVSRTNDDGSHPPCGASAGSKGRGDGARAYPKCVKKSKANKMTDKEKEAATRRKRDVYKGDGDPPKKAINVKTDSKKEAYVRQIIRNVIREESKSYPFKFVKRQTPFTATQGSENSRNLDNTIYQCYFNIRDISYQLDFKEISKSSMPYTLFVTFKPVGGFVDDVIGNDLEFMNSVLKTICSCLEYVIKREKKLYAIAFYGDTLTKHKAYLRFIKKHPFLSKFKLTKSRRMVASTLMLIKKGASNANPLSEETLSEEENVPTNPSLWKKAIALAKSKYDVYPSAYANGWAAKWYKSQGGGWKKGKKK